jgi:hypothetical protein
MRVWFLHTRRTKLLAAFRRMPPPRLQTGKHLVTKVLIISSQTAVNLYHVPSNWKTQLQRSTQTSSQEWYTDTESSNPQLRICEPCNGFSRGAVLAILIDRIFPTLS